MHKGGAPSIALTRTDAPVDVGSSSAKARGGAEGVRDQHAPEAAVSHWRWAVLGSVRHRELLVIRGTNGHGRHAGIPGHRAFPP